MDRRSFLKNAGALSLGAVAWACAKKVSPKPSASGSNTLSVVATADILAKGDSRNAFALFRGERPIGPSNVTAKLAKSEGTPFDVPVERVRARRGSGDIEGGQIVGTEVFEIYVVHHDFDPGIWLIDVHVGNEHPQPAAFQVQP